MAMRLKRKFTGGTNMIWDKLRYFKESENWGDPSKMDHNLLLRLDDFRHELGSGLIVSRGTQGKSDAKKSQHDLGLAVDVVFTTGLKMTVLDAYLLACSYGFSGVGLYTHWKFKNETRGGLHLDMRKLPPRTRAARWLASSKDETQIYFKMSVENMEKIGMIESRLF
jgi:hypothetical protein